MSVNQGLAALGPHLSNSSRHGPGLMNGASSRYGKMIGFIADRARVHVASCAIELNSVVWTAKPSKVR